MKLPPGFPVKVDIPVLPTVSARVTFHDFAWKNVDNNEAETAMETNGNDKQDDDANMNGNKNGAVGGKGSKNDIDAKTKKDKAEKGSTSSLSQKEKSKTDSKNDSNDETVSEEDEESPYLDDSLFDIPVGYVEDNTRFPDLWHLDEVGMLTVGEEERHKWRPKHQMQLLQQQQKQQLKGIE